MQIIDKVHINVNLSKLISVNDLIIGNVLIFLHYSIHVCHLKTSDVKYTTLFLQGVSPYFPHV